MTSPSFVHKTAFPFKLLTRSIELCSCKILMLIGIVVIGIVKCCYSYLFQIQERSQTHFSSYERQSKDPPGESWGLDRVCTQTWWSPTPQSSSV